MKYLPTSRFQSTLSRLVISALGISICFFSVSLSAQSADDIREQYPEVADLFNAFDITHALL